MIPATIQREHILRAITRINLTGIPPRRGSLRFSVDFNGRLYPPKLVLSLAGKYATRRELEPNRFSGGRGSNEFLRRRGFRVLERRTRRIELNGRLRPSTTTKGADPPRAHTGERCPECKRRVGQLLRRLYGTVEERYSLPLGTHPED